MGDTRLLHHKTLTNLNVQVTTGRVSGKPCVSLTDSYGYQEPVSVWPDNVAAFAAELRQLADWLEKLK